MDVFFYLCDALDGGFPVQMGSAIGGFVVYLGLEDLFVWVGSA